MPVIELTAQLFDAEEIVALFGRAFRSGEPAPADVVREEIGRFPAEVVRTFVAVEGEKAVGLAVVFLPIRLHPRAQIYGFFCDGSPESRRDLAGHVIASCQDAGITSFVITEHDHDPELSVRLFNREMGALRLPWKASHHGSLIKCEAL